MPWMRSTIGLHLQVEVRDPDAGEQAVVDVVALVGPGRFELLMIAIAHLS